MEPRSYCRIDCPIRARELNVWRVICGVLLLTSLIVSTVSQDTTDFISIDCGGDGGKDLRLDLEWLTDEGFLESEEQLKKERTTYLTTIGRLNFGGNTSSPAVRLPDDIYDRLCDQGFLDPVKAPREVLISAWEGSDMNSSLPFSFDILAAQSIRPLQSFYVQMELLDVDPRDGSGQRSVNVYLNDLGPDVMYGYVWGPDGVIESFKTHGWFNYKQTFRNDTAVFRVEPNGSSTLPAMVNMFEILGEFDSVRKRTAQLDASAIKQLSNNLGNDNTLDTAGDPCLPVPWDWLDCSIEIPPRITQINLSSSGVSGIIPEEFGNLDRLTVLDLSNSSFSGNLPESLKDIVTLRVLKVDNNNLSGELPHFKERSLVNLETLSLSQNKLSGDLSSLIQALGNPTVSLNLSHNKFSGSIPHQIQKLENLNHLDLSNNELSGILPLELFDLNKLQTLLLENNSLTLPLDIWTSISRASSLQTLNLNGNKITELDLTMYFHTLAKPLGAYKQQVTLLGNDISRVILPSDDGINARDLCSSSGESLIDFSLLIGGSSWCDKLVRSNMTLVERFLCRQDKDQNFCVPWNGNDSGAIKKALIIGLVVSGVLVLIMICILMFFLGRILKRMKDLRQIQEALAREDVRPPFYKYDELKANTEDFSTANELGRGAFGAVYKAHLPDNSLLAVKLLFPTEQSISDFLKEMVLITGIKHRHLIQLKGCCVRDKKRMLVYEYAENGNLAQALWGKNRSMVLTWSQRLNISVGIAKGLAYLHEELQPKIIHRDIKPQNILLDRDWNPKIADFGLARPVDEGSTQRATSIGGTLGYFSPEYATEGLLTEKQDVYSYGILLLEIISGRQCIDATAPQNEIYLKNWAFRSYKEGVVSRIAEQSLLETVPVEEIETMIKTALLCLQDDYERRPSMSQVSIIDPNQTERDEREESALLTTSTYSTNPKGFIELTITDAR
ncbi:hypothetical protein R1flu_005636 [Riccia fluitans]|uniref:Protein kinase domain-containing protein n=1 Tax=Riccia fluitans TaxID=41844 RepID=A0ABD1YTQ9_9MARC